MFGKNRVSMSHIDRTSAKWVLMENLIFSPLSAYSPTPRATRNTLKPSSLVNNLYAT
jgi:hypothetical protein